MKLIFRKVKIKHNGDGIKEYPAVEDVKGNMWAFVDYAPYMLRVDLNMLVSYSPPKTLEEISNENQI